MSRYLAYSICIISSLLNTTFIKKNCYTNRNLCYFKLLNQSCKYLNELKLEKLLQISVTADATILKMLSRVTKSDFLRFNYYQKRKSRCLFIESKTVATTIFPLLSFLTQGFFFLHTPTPAHYNTTLLSIESYYFFNYLNT